MIKAKRFWKDVSVVEEGGRFLVKLDARTLMTPLKNSIAVPTRALAEMIAKEWRAVEGEINPNDMPMTKRANSAIERVGAQRAEIEMHLAAYAQSDLLCYRAHSPQELILLQSAWNEWIIWVAGFGVKLKTTTGVMPIGQPEENHAKVLNWLEKWNDFELAAIYDFISITGSFVLAMAVAEGAISVENAFKLSQIDNDYQKSIWGTDEDEAKAIAFKRNELTDSFEFFVKGRKI